MRARAGEPPRTMAQKVLAGRASDPTLTGDFADVKVDQVVLVRQPARIVADAVELGLRRATVEVAVAYDGACITAPAEPKGAGPARPAPWTTTPDMGAHGVLVARAGAGFAGPVHLERFASPARLCLTDEPRLASLGGVGMLTLFVAPSVLTAALASGVATLPVPRSIQVFLSGRMRPFVGARDVALELVRRGIGDVVRRVEETHGAAVIVEIGGPSARLLSVAERSVLAQLAPALGAAAVLFTSDERTEVFLRDQRRSKAHRALTPDAGAPFEDVFSVDLGAVDPLLLDGEGKVRAPRELGGKPVSQVLLGGDGGVSLRDLLVVAQLLKSKRVPSRLELLLAPPSRQTLEVLASTGALTDLVATGARIVEPDARVLTGELYAPPRAGKDAIVVRTCDAEPRADGAPLPIVASAETVAYAVATGEVGDPRSFKRPVRITVPRALPTDDVLLVRERRSDAARGKGEGKAAALAALRPSSSWKGAVTVTVMDAGAWASLPQTPSAEGPRDLVVLCGTLDGLRAVAVAASRDLAGMRAVVGGRIPRDLVAHFSALGVLALVADDGARAALHRGKTATLSAPGQWPEDGPAHAATGDGTVPLVWVARGREREWVTDGAPVARRK